MPFVYSCFAQKPRGVKVGVHYIALDILSNHTCLFGSRCHSRMGQRKLKPSHVCHNWSALTKADQFYIILSMMVIFHPKYHHTSPHHSHKMVVPFFIDELTTCAFVTASRCSVVTAALCLQLVGGCAPKPLLLYFTQSLILLF
jgi:hypothetical protein